MKSFGVIDEIIKEPKGGAHKNPKKAVEEIKSSITDFMIKFKEKDLESLVDERYKKFRDMGNFY